LPILTKKKNGRWTSGKDSRKATELKNLQETIKADPFISKVSADKYINGIEKLVALKRNKIHFWATPQSLKEFKDLIENSDVLQQLTHSSKAPKI